MKTNLLKFKTAFVGTIMVLAVIAFSQKGLKAQSPYCTTSNTCQSCDYPFNTGAVTLGNLKWSSPGCTQIAYQYITSTTTTLTQGATYTISIDHILGRYTGNTLSSNAWIDFNNDLTFQASEAVVSSGTLKPGNSTTVPENFSYTFTVPCNAKAGKTRLRVRSGYYAAIPASNACGPLSQCYGSAEDFDITIAASSKPSANFIIPTTIYQNSPAFFTNSNQVGYTNHDWYVDDNNTGNFVKISTATNLNYKFATTGTKQIRLTSTNCIGNATITKTISVIAPNAAPTPSFVASNTNIEVKPGTLYGGNVDIFMYDLSTDGPSDWYWTFTSQEPGENGWFISEKDQNPLFITLDTGRYSICLDVSNAIGSNNLCKNDYITIDYPVSTGGGTVSKNIICDNMSSTADSGILYDNGGESDYINNNAFCTFNISSCDAQSIDITFSELEIDCYDYLRIYDGKDAKNGKLLKEYTNLTGAPSGSLTAVSGHVTVIFVTDNYNGYCMKATKGFALKWKSVKLNDGGPVANFSIPKAAGTDTVFSCASGNNILFNNTSTGSQVFTKTHWIFDYSPNIAYPTGFNNSTSQNPTYNYTTSNKTYFVRLAVESCEGVDTIIKSFYLASTTLKPQVEFVASNTILFPEESSKITNFTKASCSGKWIISPALGWAYTTGNASSSEIVVKFSKKGRYTVTREETNDNGTTSLTKSEFIEVIDYCIPGSAILSTEAGISNVKFADIDNSSTSGLISYEDFSSLGSQTIVMGKTYNLEVTRKGVTDNVDRKVWIDYNRNGLFDANELVASETNSSSASLKASITIPDYNNANIGDMKMRIVCSLTGFPTDACGTIKVGEFEDYLLKLVPDNQPPILTMLGISPYEMEVGQTYTDAGATATDNIEGDITSRIITDEQVDASQAGTYYVNYSITDNSGNTFTATRTVRVRVDMTEPVITINGGNSLIHEVNTPFVAPTASVIDNPGNNSINYQIFSNNVNIQKLGNYEVKYGASDAYGNTSEQILLVEVKDQTAPQFQLNTVDPLTIEVGTNNFVDPTTITDNYDKLQNLIITTGGTLNTKIAGTYTRTYTATDLSGNTSNFSRTFIVGDFLAPKIITQAGTENIVVEVNSIYNEPKVTALDNNGSASLKRDDGGFDINKLGVYNIVYTATDASLNVSTYTRTIQVVDTKKPVILDMPIKIDQWSNIDPTDFSQITVQDNYYDGNDFKNQQNGCKLIMVSNDVKTSDPGIYYACYQAIDGSGNLSDLNCLVVKVTANTAGIADGTFANNINVYPNPSQGEFNVNFVTGVSSQVKVSVINMLGEVISTYSYKDINSNKLIIDMSNNAAGVYMLNIEDNNSIATKKITLTK